MENTIGSQNQTPPSVEEVFTGNYETFEEQQDEWVDDDEEIAEEEDEDDIANFAQDRIRKHKKFAWMLRASLDNNELSHHEPY